MCRFYPISMSGDDQSWEDEEDYEGCCEDPYEDEDDEKEWCD